MSSGTVGAHVVLGDNADRYSLYSIAGFPHVRLVGLDSPGVWAREGTEGIHLLDW